MPESRQASATSEKLITVDMNASDPAKAVERTSSDIARGVREDGETDHPQRSKAERDLFKRMGRLERNMQKNFDQKLADREAEWQRQRSEMQSKLDRLSVERGGEAGDAADRAHEAQLAALKEKLAAAYEKGDSTASADLTLQISHLDAKYWAKKAAAAGVVTREQASEKTTAAQQSTQQPQGKGPTVAGSRFIRANDEWWDDPEFQVEQAAANTIYLKLVQSEGFDPKDDETFKEVARQLKVKFPTLAVKAGRRDADEDEEEPAENTRQGRHTSPVQRIDDRGTASQVNRGSRRTLTKQEMETMRACRLDPDNDKDVVQFLREAVAMEAAS